MTYLSLNTVLRTQQGHCRKCGGGQQHGNQEFGSDRMQGRPRLVLFVLAHKLIAGAVNCAEMYRLTAVVLQLLPQTQDVRVHGARRGIIVVPPHFV